MILNSHAVRRLIVLVGLLANLGLYSSPASAQDAFIGEIRYFAGNCAPRGWAFCDGQLLSIDQFPALFSILGTTYGGDGRTTFALPDARGRALVHASQGPGLSYYSLGQTGGTEDLSVQQAEVEVGSQSPISVFTLFPGGNSNLQPFVTANCIIAIEGYYPSRS